MVTSDEVARAAGVSQPTVSRALRDSPRISAATKARVREAAERLGYVPSRHGRQLRTKRSGRIGVLATEVDNPFYMSLLAVLHESLREHGYATVVLTEAVTSPTALDELVDGSLDGVVLTNCRLRSDLPAVLRDRGVPAVTLNRETEPAVADACAVANGRGGALVARALLAAGHTRLAHLAGPANTSTGRDRAAGFRRAAASAGFKAAVRRGEFTSAAGFAGMRSLFEHGYAPSAVFCGNDVIALGALNAARALGLRVPRDVSIVGFDDIPMASWEIADLATVRYDLRALGRTGADLLVSRLARPDLPIRRELLEPRFVPRGSLARASPHDPRASPHDQGVPEGL